MSDANLAHACTVMDLPAAQATPEFLKDQLHDVRMYTPRLIERYTFDRQVNEAILQLAAEVYAFKGDFLELTPAVATSFPTTPLVASMNTAKGSHFLHQLELPREVAVLLKVQNLCTQRMFWLTNHTRLQAATGTHTSSSSTAQPRTQGLISVTPALPR